MVKGSLYIEIIIWIYYNKLTNPKRLGEKTMVNLPERFINNIKEILLILTATLNDNLSEIILFGSCARGEIKTGSDIDLLIITHVPIDTHKARGEIRDLLDDYNVDLVFYSKEMFQDATSLFVNNIKRDMISLWKEGVLVEEL